MVRTVLDKDVGNYLVIDLDKKEEASFAACVEKIYKGIKEAQDVGF